jgi:hypothetical protein
MLVDGGENKVTSFKLNKYDYAVAQLDTKGDANMNDSHEIKHV